jgi:UDP-N-acetylglucosamine--N-acetylmuramyl-(pentapeptide) pyrophosphoryl-undecaprenol N-acetylglucosamine transferase
MSTPCTILFAGGGTGGHIFPNVAVVERLHEQLLPVTPHFLVSDRPLDGQILAKHHLAFTVLPAQPFSLQPRKLFAFIKSFRESERLAAKTIVQTRAAAMIATGGFVCAPAVAAAQKMQIPVALVNLDAVPGRANKLMANRATEVFTVYPQENLPRAQCIGMPLRRSAVSDMPAAKARRQIGLDPDKETLLITAGSQGASTINQMMIELCSRTEPRKAFADWQILHLTGVHEREDVAAAYREAGLSATVEAFYTGMGLAWSAASLAISRAGAGSVAEAWVNAVPTIFLPYPFHRDEHQRHNTEPLVNQGAALLLRDEVDPETNVAQLTGPLVALMRNAVQRSLMRQALRETRPADGATSLALWIAIAAGIAPPGFAPGIAPATQNT